MYPWIPEQKHEALGILKHPFTIQLLAETHDSHGGTAGPSTEPERSQIILCASMMGLALICALHIDRLAQGHRGFDGTRAQVSLAPHTSMWDLHLKHESVASPLTGISMDASG